MNTSESEIEKMLRGPQRFTPPAGLKERLVEQIPARGDQARARTLVVKPASGGWLRRWWPALAPAAVSVACAVVFTAQQGKIRELKTANQALVQAVAATPDAAQARSAPDAAPTEPSPEIQQEIDRLKELVARLKSEIAGLRQMQSENRKLSAQLAAPQELNLTPEETEALAKAKERAQSINCVNNLKQFGLAVRVWALDNGDSNPPDILSMSNELSTPKILVCPADTTRQMAKDWSSFTMANCSYEFLVPAEKEADNEPQRVSVRCPIHGHIGLCDGSVQSRVAKDHPERLVERDGKLYLTTPSPPPQASSPPPPGMTEEQAEMYRRRYGLSFPAGTAPNLQPNAATNATEEQLRIWKERYGIK